MNAPALPPFILASTSRYRRELLSRLGVPFETCAPLVDEETLKDPALSPEALAEKLAAAKAGSLLASAPQAVILGSDQVCACEGQILNKPGDFANACQQLEFLSGRTHQLFTAVCLVYGEERLQHVDITSLHMRRLTRAEIERYVAADEPYDCVGSYKLEQRGITLFESIDARDHTAITGLPLIAVSHLLRTYGYEV